MDIITTAEADYLEDMLTRGCVLTDDERFALDAYNDQAMWESVNDTAEECQN